MLVPGPPCTGVPSFPTTDTPTRSVFVCHEPTLTEYARIINSIAVLCELAEATSHICVVCRILGIPVLVLPNALRLLSEAAPVHVDPTAGLITQAAEAAPLPPPPMPPSEGCRIRRPIGLRYQLSIIDSPALVDQINLRALDDVDSLFLRSELIWIAHNIDPFAALGQEGPEWVTSFLTKSLLALARRLRPSQCLNFRSLDLRSDHLRQFGSSSAVEPNPHLGLHGIRQMLTLPGLLAAELRAVDALYNHGYSRVLFSIPFLSLESELIDVLALRDTTCRNRVRMGVFVETPAAVAELPHLLAHDVDAVFVGTKDLTQLLMAADRDNPAVAHLLDPLSRPVLNTLKTILDVCHDADREVYLFAFAEQLPALLVALPFLGRVSMPASDYLHMLGAPAVDSAR